MQLSDFVGHEIVVMIPKIDAENVQTVKLLGVEAGGIWIESQSLTNTLLAAGSVATSRTIGFFLPYSQILFAVAAGQGISLNEKAFGL
jgi:hypothetical protein